MKVYHGNYLGMVINSSDPEYRGRVQVFIPHVMPALYDDWNKEGADIQISCVGSNIPEGLSQEVHARLVKILPWAESASPIVGGSAPGNLFSSILGGAAAGAATGGVAGALVGAATGAANHFYNQSPTSNPTVVGGELSTLLNNATNYGNIPATQLQSSNGRGQCGQGARMVLGSMTGNNHFAKGLSSGGSEKASSLTVNGGNSYLQTSGMFNSPQSAPANYKDDPSQWKIGDVFVSNGGDSVGNGHIQVWTGKAWVSDFTQKGVGGISPSYGNFTLVRMNQTGIDAIKANSQKNGLTLSDSTPSTPGQESTGGSAAPAPASPQKNKEGIAGAAPTPQQGAVVPTEGAGQVAGTVSGGGTATTGNAKLASDRQAKFGSENQEAIMSRLQVLAEREVGGKPAAIQAFIETTVNRAYFSNRSLDKILYESGYGFTDSTTATPSPAVREAFNKVMNGSNMTNLATDAGFNLPNSGRGKNGLFITGMQSKDYVIQGVVDLKTGKQVTDPALLNKLYTEGDRTGNYEFFVRQSRSTTAAGIEKYAQENGITSDGFQSDILPTLDATGGALASTSVVHNTDSNGRTPVFNTNDMAKGMFAYPNPGAMVWVFFREGNPLYPVYFAASYSSAEWQSAYRGSSPGDLRDHSNPGEALTTSTIQNFGALSLLSKTKISLTDPLENESVAMLGHEQGSGLTMTNSCDFYRSSSNRRDEVDNDRHIVTRGYKEEWVQGDASTNTRGDAIIKIGNISQEAIDAMTELSNMSYEANQKLMNKPK